MLYKYDLNIKTSWSSLPWKKIHTKILVIQKKIYKAAKLCHFNRLYKLQKYLLNTDEFKMFSIKSITEQIYLFNTVKCKKNIFLSDIEKFKIFKNLYNKKIIYSQESHFLIRHAKFYLIYLSIKPEYLAKFVYKYDCYKKVLKKYIVNCFCNKNTNILKIRKIFKCFQNISYDKYCYSNRVCLFINSIFSSSLYWYKQYEYKLQILLNKKNAINTTQSLFNLKYYNYTKYISNFFLLNNLNNFFQISNSLMFFIQNTSAFYLHFNKKIYYKLKKKYKNIFFNYTYFVFKSKVIHKSAYVTQLRYIFIHYCI